MIRIKNKLFDDFSGYGLAGDLQMLAKSLPTISNYLSKPVRTVDLHELQAKVTAFF